jgi:hypothetical protein
MSSPLLVAVAAFVRDLLAYDEQLIRIGRQNFERKQFETAYIVIDALGQQARTASLETYDHDAEEMSYGAVHRGVVTLDFYGAGAYTRANTFGLLVRSQAALELKKTLGVDIHQPSGLTDVKALTGQQYGERVQVEMVVELGTETVADTLRIDTAILEIRNEDGVQYDG